MYYSLRAVVGALACFVFGLWPGLTIAQDDCGWSAAPAALEVSGPISVVLVHDDGSGQALYAAGEFLSVDGGVARRVARWDGSLWSEVGSGLAAEVYDLAVFDAGNGLRLYAGGMYGLLGQSTLASWDGSVWAAVPGTPTVWLGGMGVSSVGGVAELYVSGPTPDYIRRWDGTTWRAVGSGLHGIVWDYAEFDDGSGPALFAGGGMAGLYKFDGADWSSVGSEFSIDGVIEALATFDDGAGEALYVGGSFTRVPEFQDALRVARWDGSAWTPVGEGFNDTVLELVVFDDGTGLALYAAGAFTHSGSTPTGHIAWWDGTAWQPVEGGTDGLVTAMCATPAGQEGGVPRALYLGGGFTTAGERTSPWFAAFVACACSADFNGDGTVDTLDVLGFLNAWSAGDAAADFNGDGAVNTLDMLEFLNAWNVGC